METTAKKMPSGLLLNLGTLISMRRDFQELYAWKKHGRSVASLTSQEKNAIIKDMVLGGVGELMEFLEKATNWKEHRPLHGIDRAAALEEFVDSINFLLGIFPYMDLTIEEFWLAFQRKHQITMQRFVQEFPTVVTEVAASQDRDKLGTGEVRA